MNGKNQRRSSGLVIACLLLAAFADQVEAYGGEVWPDKTCYNYDEEIIITFEIDDPGTDDWIGIYPADLVSGELEPSMWVSRSKIIVWNQSKILVIYETSQYILAFVSALVVWNARLLGKDKSGPIHIWRRRSQRRLP